MRRLDKRVWPMRIAFAAVAVNVGIFCCAKLTSDRSWIEILSYLDSGWYDQIARFGYHTVLPGKPEGTQFAFFPLWPLWLRMNCLLFRTDIAVFVGTGLASAMTLMFLWWLHNIRKTNHALLRLADSRWSVALLLLAPGSWVLFSNHTEALFLILSFLSFYFAYKNDVVKAGVLAGLCALTRNQGTVVAVTAGLILLTVEKDKKFKAFLLCGAISGGIFLSWPLYQYWVTGEPLKWIKVQKQWTIVSTPFEYFENLFWISSSLFALLRKFVFWLAVVGGSVMLFGREKIYRPLGFYVLASALLLPLQGYNIPQTFRFLCVVFPLWFWVGKSFDSHRRIPTGIGFIVSIMLLGLNATLAYNFAFHQNWPY